VLCILVLTSDYNHMTVSFSLILTPFHESDVVTFANLTENIEYVCDSCRIRIGPNYWYVGATSLYLPT